MHLHSEENIPDFKPAFKKTSETPRHCVNPNCHAWVIPFKMSSGKERCIVCHCMMEPKHANPKNTPNPEIVHAQKDEVH